jgi:hypothetical protein
LKPFRHFRLPLLPGIFLPLIISGILPGSEEDFRSAVRPLLAEHCTRCHGEKGKTKGKVDLLAIESLADLESDPDFLEELVSVIEFSEMPPEDEPPLPDESRRALLDFLERSLKRSLEADSALPRTPIRRMNRFQYSNAVQDLFELNAEVFTLPERMLREHGNYFQPATGKMPDQVKVGSRPLGKSQLIEKRLAGVAAFPQDLRAEHGFDNRGDHLSLSPLLLESFLTLSRSIVESPDFHEKSVGTWPGSFAPPASSADSEAELRQRIEHLLTRAFRRPPGEETVSRYTAHALARMETGDSFLEAMKAVASAAIASPRFLYLYDRTGDETGRSPIDDYELASRLSFFLWGSLPDDELLDLARSGKLSDPETLTTQVSRILKDDKLQRFCDSVPSQWLQLDRIITSVPDPEQHPEFYFAKYRASMHMMLEPLLLFETVLVENRSLLELVDPEFSYRSNLLTAWYATGRRGKSTPPTTIAFDRVPITDRREGGVITNAAVMTMTSNATRSQPITRGAWVATAIFNDPPEPPPADVPPLPEEPGEDEKNLTLRERLDAHREQESCKGCHAKIDPLGFAFENYGPTGIWRDAYENGREVNASGVLFRKHPFSTPVEFKDALLAEKDRFVRAFASHLLSFALGRETVAADSIALDRIVERVGDDDHRFHTLIREIVQSEPFRYKSNPPGNSP